MVGWHGLLSRRPHGLPTHEELHIGQQDGRQPSCWPTWLNVCAALVSADQPSFTSCHPFPQVAGIPAKDFVYISFANAALGATPYIIALHRWLREGISKCSALHAQAEALLSHRSSSSDQAIVPPSASFAHPKPVPTRLPGRAAPWCWRCGAPIPWRTR